MRYVRLSTRQKYRPAKYLSGCKQFNGSFWSLFIELVTYFQEDEVRKQNIFCNTFELNSASGRARARAVAVRTSLGQHVRGQCMAQPRKDRRCPRLLERQGNFVSDSNLGGGGAGRDRG